MKKIIVCGLLLALYMGGRAQTARIASRGHGHNNAGAASNYGGGFGLPEKAPEKKRTKVPDTIAVKPYKPADTVMRKPAARPVKKHRRKTRS